MFRFGVLFLLAIASARKIIVNNKCNHDVWVATLTNDKGQPLDGGIPKLGSGGSFTFNIPDGGWGGRIWPKLNCDGSGQACEVGQSENPCGPNGCDPPSDTKIEFHFPNNVASERSWYDISLVDGYSLGVEIVPSQTSNVCTTTRCNLSLNDCPTNENDVGDLRVSKDGKTLSCLSPCKKWNYPSPFGMGKSEKEDPGLHLCCPHPPVSSEECRSGIVVKTKYVGLVHDKCPTAYSYAFDDDKGLHNCPGNIDFTVNFCL